MWPWGSQDLLHVSRVRHGLKYLYPQTKVVLFYIGFLSKKTTGNIVHELYKCKKTQLWPESMSWCCHFKKVYYPPFFSQIQNFSGREAYMIIGFQIYNLAHLLPCKKLQVSEFIIRISTLQNNGERKMRDKILILKNKS